jgi:hypothetical protein
MGTKTVTVNRAPVLTLWAAVVAERLGYDAEAALTLGKAVAGLNAQAKGRTLGIFGSQGRGGAVPGKKHGLGEEFWIEICGRPVPAKTTPAGVRAVVKDKPIDPEQVRAYLRRSFGDDLDAVRDAMERLAESVGPGALAESAFALYERFRPAVARGQRGWGQKGTLDLDRIRAAASRSRGKSD